MHEEKKLTNENFIMLPNQLIEANYAFGNEIELKIYLNMIFLALSNKETQENIFKFSMRDIFDNAEITEHKIMQVSNACKNLMRRVATPYKTQKEKTFFYLNIISSAELSNGILTLKFNQDFLNLLRETKTNFSKILLLFIFKLKSSYALKIYMFLKKTKFFKKSETIDIDRLRHIAEADKKYSRTDDLKKNVLDIAQKNIKKYTDIKFNYDIIYKGKTPSFINFLIEDNIPEDEQTRILLEQERNLEPRHLKIINELIEPQNKKFVLENCSEQKLLYYYQKAKEDEKLGKIKTTFSFYFQSLLIFDYDNYQDVQELPKVNNDNLEKLENEIADKKAREFIIKNFSENSICFVISQANQKKKFKTSRANYVFGFFQKYQDEPKILDKIADNYYKNLSSTDLKSQKITIKKLKELEKEALREVEMELLNV